MAPSSIRATATRTLRTKITTSANKPTFAPILMNRGITGTTRKSTSLESNNSMQQQPHIPFLPRGTFSIHLSAKPNPLLTAPPPTDYPSSYPTTKQTPTTTTTNPFNHLLTSLTTHLTTSPRPCIPTLTHLLSTYKSNPEDWQKYAHRNPEKQYTRNLVTEVEGVFNLLMLVWTPGKESKVHDHASSHCLMRVLGGGVREVRWVAPEGEGEEMEVEGVRDYRMGKVAYMCDEMGLHSIANPSKEEYAVTLHLYTPPGAAMRGCHVFDPATGEKTHVMQGKYDSVRGVVNEDA
ncbi:Cysteine dioxygenase protein [Rutstroemia sp. NJR-2017a WRK4]|nr:Cysteine dioxygenase protein [Rutstroemia sp. NJR-2017a WRK4]